MKRVLIFGNSGSGKSTLAQHLCSAEQLPHLDLDTLAWKPVSPPERKPISESRQEILNFIDVSDSWVIEGCYSDLLEIAEPFSTEIIFLNLPIEACIENAQHRPWEPHKYKNKEEQDSNLGMLIEWIAQYPKRTDTFSKSSHTRLYDQYAGKKTMYTSNDQASRHHNARENQ